MHSDSTTDSKNSFEVIADLAIGDEGDGRVCRWIFEQENVEQFTLRLAASLRHSRIVFVPDGEARGSWANQLLTTDRLRQHISEGFSKLIVLDVAAGLDEHGRFQLSNFYRYAFAQIVAAFGVEPGGAYHEEDIAQFLRDESGLCLCILNAHLAPSLERKRLRCLTQEGHASLVVFHDSASGERDDSRATPLDSENLPAALQSKMNPSSHFLVVRSDSGIAQYPLHGSIITLGRHPDCDIVLDHSAVGRRHAELNWANGVWCLRDLGSRNGTYFDNKAIPSDTSTSVGFGVSFSICDYQLSLHESMVNLKEIVSLGAGVIIDEGASNDLSETPLDHLMLAELLNKVSDDFDDCGSVSIYDLIRRAEQDSNKGTTPENPPPKPIADSNSKQAAAETLKKFFNRK
ncbi:MAG: FHA domain-containing protein [Planctomycetaceae bacterium]|nr:FHA domain-containing protein [Planctomycetaceae bacterium]